MALAGLLVIFPFLMAYAASSDLLTMLIPNRLSIALVVAFAMTAAAAGLSGEDIALHVLTGGLTLCVTFTLFALGFVGGGDAKLAAGTTLWIGFDQLGSYAVVASALGGALTLAILAVRSHPLPAVIGELPFASRLHDRKTGIPYGIALAAAGLFVLPETTLWARALGN